MDRTLGHPPRAAQGHESGQGEGRQQAMIEDEKRGVISVRVRELAQLFNSLDPSPFHERDLDTDAEEYIVGWARELPADVSLTLAVYLPEAEAAKARERGLSTALANYFAYRATTLDRDLRELFRIGFRHLRVGVPLLIGCLLASQLLPPVLPRPAIANLIEESLILVGWVANWKPLEIFLYDWWPIRRRRDLYLRLADARIEIMPAAT